MRIKRIRKGCVCVRVYAGIPCVRTGISMSLINWSLGWLSDTSGWSTQTIRVCTLVHMSERKHSLKPKYAPEPQTQKLRIKEAGDQKSTH